MKKIFEKHELPIAIFLIVLYIVVNSACLNTFGEFSYITALTNAILSIAILSFIVSNKLVDYFKLNKFPKPKKFLYFIPLLLLISVNLLSGFNINNTVPEIISYMISMIFVGFLEEIIFRGFLYQSMVKDSERAAIIVTSLTFGIGHILNLLNGADIIPTLVQIVYSTTAGFMFVTLLRKGNSLWPCIITHSLVNALSIFNEPTTITTYVGPLILIVVSVFYTIYLTKRVEVKE
jgi:membrane protease YdiL (CAAX protease family)